MGKVLVEMEEETFQFLKNLGEEIATQDNRMTAKPYVIALRSRTEQPANPDYHRVDKTYFISDDGERWDSEAELFEARPDHKRRDITECHMRYVWEDRNWFFTDKAVEDHLRINRHNLIAPQTFMYYANRNRELDGIFKALEEFRKAAPLTSSS